MAASNYEYSEAIKNTIPIMNIFRHKIGIKLDGKNYLLWKGAVLPIIKAFDSEGFILGTHPCPPQHISIEAGQSTAQVNVNPAFLAWNRHDQLLMAWLLSSFTEDSLVLAIGTNTSGSLWSLLETMYTQTSENWILNQVRILQNQVNHQANMPTANPSPITTHLHHISK